LCSNPAKLVDRFELFNRHELFGSVAVRLDGLLVAA
jgi:hypothetical protein